MKQCPNEMGSGKATSLKNYLCNSRFERNPQPPSITKCPKNCITCQHLICSDTFTFENNLTFKIKHSFTCNATDIIYGIKCLNCPRTYLGETSNLKRRVSLHKNQISMEQYRNIYVVKHLYTCCKNLEQKFSIMPLYQCNKDDEKFRQFKEQQLVKKYQPSLNK